MVSVAALRGYLLEELVAQLLRDAGYRLLGKADADAQTLTFSGRGLEVRGRGCFHQVDVLGSLSTPVPFGAPLRLFVEAKFRGEEKPSGERLGVEVVRNAFGVLHDVNQFTPPTSQARHNYQYTLISTSGFSDRAQDFAWAHGITLHDFSGAAWKLLRDTVKEAADALISLIEAKGTLGTPLTAVRMLLRAALGTLDEDARKRTDPSYLQDGVDRRVHAAARTMSPPVPDARVRKLLPILHRVVAQQDRALLIGYPSGQMMLALRPDDTAALGRYLDDALQRHAADVDAIGQAVQVAVDVDFDPARDPEQPGAGDWVLSPRDSPGAFHLRVGVPERVEHRLWTTDGTPLVARPTSSITVYWRGRPIELIFPLTPAKALTPGEALPDRTLREDRIQQRVAIPKWAQQPVGSITSPEDDARDTPPEDQSDEEAPHEQAPHDQPDDEPDEEDPAKLWEPHEVQALLAELQRAAPRSAAAAHALKVFQHTCAAGGRSDRAEVLRWTDVPEGGRFSGCTGPVSMATAKLKKQGIVDGARSKAMATTYPVRGYRGRADGVHVRPEIAPLVPPPPAEPKPLRTGPTHHGPVLDRVPTQQSGTPAAR